MSFTITILGSSGALPAYGRFPSSQHLTIQNQQFLIDCGEGCQMQLIRFGFSVLKINHIFISHLHGDHYLGLTGLIFSMHLQRRTADLHLYSFKGLDEILTAQFRHSKSSLHFKIVFHTLHEGEIETIFDNEIIQVETIPLDHKVKTSGFLFREKLKPYPIDKSKLTKAIQPEDILKLKRGEDVKDEAGKVLYAFTDYTLARKPSRAYAYCSDTQPSDSIVARIQGVNLLYHEATFMEEEKSKARETRHSTAAEAADVAMRGKVGQLIIGHFSARYRDLTPVLAEAIAKFPNTSLAIEGETFEIHP